MRKVHQVAEDGELCEYSKDFVIIYEVGKYNELKHNPVPEKRFDGNVDSLFMRDYI